jgi:predicted nucleic acid-binding protein
MPATAASKISMAVRYVFDSNIYIHSMQDRQFAARHEAEYIRRIPLTYFCSVVVQEILIGCLHDLAVKRAQAFYKPFERVRRIVNPLYPDWEETGIIGRKIIRKYPHLKTKRFALINDILIALCCRRIGATLITQNRKDFQVIPSIKPFRFETWD